MDKERPCVSHTVMDKERPCASHTVTCKEQMKRINALGVEPSTGHGLPITWKDISSMKADQQIAKFKKYLKEESKKDLYYYLYFEFHHSVMID